MRKGRSVKNFLIAVIIAFGATALFWGAAAAVETQTVVSGVTVLDCDLSGTTPEIARRRLADLEREMILNTPLVLRYAERAWHIQPRSIGLTLDSERILEEAMNVCRRGSALQRWGQWRRARTEGVRIPPYVKIDREKLDRELAGISSEITVTPEDARLKFNPDETVEVAPSREGITVDGERVYSGIKAVYEDPDSVPEIFLSLVRAQPRITTRDVAEMGIDGLLASYTTTFDEGDAGRVYNIRAAASALDGQAVPPGEVFSFNKIVGPRSSEFGYKNAKVIVNNEFVEGLGGGICQVSSTLYNAVLLANLEILERAAHSLPVSYVLPGRDATVTFENIDFRFRNPTTRHIYLRALVNPGRITVKIYGNSHFRRQVTIRTRVEETIPYREIYQEDPALSGGQFMVKRKGVPGMRVTAERVVLDGDSYRVEALPESLYHPVDQLVATGPGFTPQSDIFPQGESGPIPPGPRPSEEAHP